MCLSLCTRMFELPSSLDAVKGFVVLVMYYCSAVTMCLELFLSATLPSYFRANKGKEDGKTCKRVAIRTTIRKDDCRSNAPVRERRKKYNNIKS